MAKIYGLIGRNISYSFSARYFSEKFKNLGRHDHQYLNYDLGHIEDFKQVLKDNPGLLGLNVTIPYKEAIIPYLDALDPQAQEIGAVNTIAIKNGKLTGYNTDTYGFQAALTPLLNSTLLNALVLGTGGASKAVVYTLKKMGIRVQQVSRSKRTGCITYPEIDENIMADHLLIINCTPLGTFPEVEEKPDLPYQWLTADHILFDLIYNPEKTSFLKEGEKRGATLSNGYEMLVQQAEKAWEIWRA